MLLTWREATAAALYGRGGFYVREEPRAHFRTSAHVPSFARAVAALADRHGLRTVVDLGAGGGELVAGLAALQPDLALHGVDLAPRPVGLAPAVGWTAELPRCDGALVVANEWLDSVPVDVLEQTGDGPRLVLVDPRTGGEALGDAPAPNDLAWLDRWWPLRRVGERAEVGLPRDAAWAAVVRAVDGVAVAVDYAHTRDERAAGAYADGTLRAHRGGRLVRPVPDGSCDVTSAVALDAVQAAGEQAGATTLAVSSQRDAMDGLLEAGGLQQRLERAELRDPAALGGFTWLVQRCGVRVQ
ncbi:SAM-dependent MidA family methyltransferase [Motilibacter peucedani]|uniref:SAM-dependent MidA family methyltransferase n=1 Tax=Motilibacter peucedani TaxID=598650 RepID=A0A420XPS3_9ACTN|nr:SAM-dependent methyltransferase [Motilibacter peucedani]RKS75260.1 SAM-dependent MidA family methyltransferase [Motilibacter peucedani]